MARCMPQQRACCNSLLQEPVLKATQDNAVQQTTQGCKAKTAADQKQPCAHHAGLMPDHTMASVHICQHSTSYG